MKKIRAQKQKSGTRKATQIAQGEYAPFNCVILDNSRVSCWGRNDYGQLGDGNSGVSGPEACSGKACSTTPVDNITLPGNRSALKITAGGSHACVILDNSSVSC